MSATANPAPRPGDESVPRTMRLGEVAQRPVTDLSAPSHVEQRLAISGARS